MMVSPEGSTRTTSKLRGLLGRGGTLLPGGDGFLVARPAGHEEDAGQDRQNQYDDANNDVTVQVARLR
jgi:hypothetical protein